MNRTGPILLCALLAACPEASKPAADAGTDSVSDVGPPPVCPPGCQKKGLHLCATADDGRCVECRENRHCAGNPHALGPICDVARNLCACAADVECAANENGTRCDPGALHCNCASDADCPAARRCIGSLGGVSVCRMPCAENTDCPAARPRCDSAGLCTACHNAADCALSPDGARCQEDGTCGCSSDSDCKGDRRCHPLWGSCVAPLGTDDECKTDADCVGSSHGPHCHAKDRRCTCLADAECKAPLATCTLEAPSSSYGRCQKPCAKDADCQAGLLCHPGAKKCVACLVDGDCTPPSLLCDPGLGRCVECASDQACTASPNGARCIRGRCGCEDNTHCQGAYPWGPTCDASLGRCLCTSDKDCSLNPHGPVCSFSKCTCTADSECTTVPYTRCGLAAFASNNPLHYCQEPCASDTECPVWLRCQPSTQKCVQCLSNADCNSWSTSRCDSLQECVECQGHADCAQWPFSKICAPGQGCVECLTDKDCGLQMCGSTCTAGKCRCAADADCVGHDPGLWCDPTQKRCGCRSDQDCPGTKTCAGTFLAIPTCEE